MKRKLTRPQITEIYSKYSYDKKTNIANGVVKYFLKTNCTMKLT